jgi:hypothetical protein
MTKKFKKFWKLNQTYRENKIREYYHHVTELKTAGHHRIMVWSHAAGSLTLS